MGSEDRHITRIKDIEANVRANLDAAQTAILSDQDEEHVYMDAAGTNLHYPANQYYWSGAAIVYEDADFNELTLHSDLLVDEYIKFASATDNSIRFEVDQVTIAAGGVDAAFFEDDRVYLPLDTVIGADTAPDDILTVNTTSTGGITINGTSARPVLSLIADVAGEESYVVYKNATQEWRMGGSISAAGQLTIQDVTDGRNDMMFDGAGNIGIRTNAPSEILDVNGNLRVRQSGGTATGPIEISDRFITASQSINWNKYLDVSTWKHRGADYTGGISFNITGDMVFATGPTGADGVTDSATAKITLLNSGLVGIGKIDPGNKFVVLPASSGDGIAVREADDGNNAVLISATATAGKMEIFNAGTARIQLHGLVNNDSWFNTGGAFGIGTDSPTSSSLTLGDSYKMYLEESINFTGATGVNQIQIPDNLEEALIIGQSTNDYLTFVSTDGAEKCLFGYQVVVQNTTFPPWDDEQHLLMLGERTSVTEGDGGDASYFGAGWYQPGIGSPNTFYTSAQGYAERMFLDNTVGEFIFQVAESESGGVGSLITWFNLLTVSSAKIDAIVDIETTGDISVASGSKLNLEGSSGNSYLLYNSGTIEVWVDGVKVWTFS